MITKLFIFGDIFPRSAPQIPLHTDTGIMSRGIDRVGHITTGPPITTWGVVGTDKGRTKRPGSGFANPKEITRVLFDFHRTYHRRGHFHAIGTITLARGGIATFVDLDGGSIASGNRGGEFFTIKLIGVDIGNFAVKNIGKGADCFGIANQNIGISRAGGIVFGIISGAPTTRQDFYIGPR